VELNVDTKEVSIELAYDERTFFFALLPPVESFSTLAAECAGSSGAL